jgi:hypothetical protein
MIQFPFDSAGLDSVSFWAFLFWDEGLLNGAIRLVWPQPQPLALLGLKRRKFCGEGRSYMPAFQITPDESLSVATYTSWMETATQRGGEADWPLQTGGCPLGIRNCGAQTHLY